MYTDNGLYGYSGECTMCNGFGNYTEWRISGATYLEPCEHCNGSGMEPPEFIRVRLILG
jgi:DnaJ-class molecular chaperone